MIKDLTNLEEFTLENKTNEVVAIRYYLVNFVEKLNPGDIITITPRSSEELAYYMKIQEELEVSEAKKLMPEDFAKIAMKYLVEEKGYDFISITPNGEEDDQYKFIFNSPDGIRTNMRIYADEETENVKIIAKAVTWKITMSTSGTVENYEEISH